MDEVSAKVEAFREKAKGLIQKAGEAIGEFLDDPARAIINGLLHTIGMDPGQFWGIVDRISVAIDAISDDPAGFADTLLEGVSLGFSQFTDNFGAHLKNGLLNWLFKDAGISVADLPTEFTLEGLLQLGLQVMGLTWDSVKEMIAEKLGVSDELDQLEQIYEYVQMFQEKGFAGMLDMIKEKLDPKAIGQMIQDAVIDMITETLATAVAAEVAKILAAPVGGILKGVEMIYKGIKWVIDNADRIMALVETVLGAVEMVIAGDTAGIATAIESTLAQLIPPVIGLFAKLIGLGDLPQKVQGTIEKMQTAIKKQLEKAVDWVIEKAKGLFGGRSNNASPGNSQNYSGPLGERVKFKAEDEDHTIWTEVIDGSAVTKVASTPMTVDMRIGDWEDRLSELVDGDQARARALIASARTKLATLDKTADREAGSLVIGAQGTAPAQHARKKSFKIVEDGEAELAVTLGQLFTLYGDKMIPAEVDGRYEHSVKNYSALEPDTEGFFKADKYSSVNDVSGQMGRADLALLKTQARAEQKGRTRGARWRLKGLSSQELVTRLVREILVKGRKDPSIGNLSVTDGSTLVFTKEELLAFCKRVGLATDAELSACIEDIVRVLLAKSEIETVSGGYSWSDIPEKRFFPSGWKGETIRAKFYVNGSGFGTMRNTIFERDLGTKMKPGRIWKAILLFENSSPNAEDAWEELIADELVSDQPFDSALVASVYTKKSTYDVDHAVALAKHWCVGDDTVSGDAQIPGFNSTQDARQDIAGNKDHLRLMPGGDNRGRGAEGYGYMQKPYVGRDFQGPSPNKFEAVPGVKWKNYE